MSNRTYSNPLIITLAPAYRSNLLNVYLSDQYDTRHEIPMAELVDDLIALARDDKDPGFQAGVASTPAQLRALAERIEAALSTYREQGVS